MNIALYAGSFNPPGLHHREVIQKLENIFDKIVIIPCGQSPIKKGIMENKHRVEMIRLAFTEKEKVKIDFQDILNETFVRPYEIENEYKDIGTSWYVIGSDIIIGGAKKNSNIHKYWKDGYNLWDKLNFAIITRPGYLISNDDLPPKHILINKCDRFKFGYKNSNKIKPRTSQLIGT